MRHTHTHTYNSGMNFKRNVSVCFIVKRVVLFHPNTWLANNDSWHWCTVKQMSSYSPECHCHTFFMIDSPVIYKLPINYYKEKKIHFLSRQLLFKSLFVLSFWHVQRQIFLFLNIYFLLGWGSNIHFRHDTLTCLWPLSFIFLSFSFFPSSHPRVLVQEPHPVQNCAIWLAKALASLFRVLRVLGVFSSTLTRCFCGTLKCCFTISHCSLIPYYKQVSGPLLCYWVSPVRSTPVVSWLDAETPSPMVV